MIIPSWLAAARRYIGTLEKSGSVHNPVIVKFWDQADIRLRVVDDETPWCAAFVGAMITQCGYRSTGSGLARSYANSKEFIKIELPSPVPIGAIVVFASPTRGPNAGHVGFLEAFSGDHLLVLGGNQGDAVRVSTFPKRNLIGFYWPAHAPSHLRFPEAPTVQATPTEVSDR